MTDIVDHATRSRMMSGIRSRHTKPEMLVRSMLHRQGFRFRLHIKQLPGKPDIVLPRYRAAIFVHGCFWHGHDCPLFRMPRTREDFWRMKINRNRENDDESRDVLLIAGFRVGIVWECSLRGPTKDLYRVSQTLCQWLRSEERTIEIRG